MAQVLAVHDDWCVFQRAELSNLPASGGDAAGPPPRLASAVGRFMLASLAAIAVIVVGGFLALRQVTIREAERDTRERVQAEAHLVEVAGLSDGAHVVTSGSFVLKSELLKASMEEP